MEYAVADSVEGLAADVAAAFGNEQVPEDLASELLEAFPTACFVRCAEGDGARRRAAAAVQGVALHGCPTPPPAGRALLQGVHPLWARPLRLGQPAAARPAPPQRGVAAQQPGGCSHEGADLDRAGHQGQQVGAPGGSAPTPAPQGAPSAAADRGLAACSCVGWATVPALWGWEPRLWLAGSRVEAEPHT